MTPTELDLQSVIDGKDAQIRSLTEELSALTQRMEEVHSDHAERLKEKNQKTESLQVQIDALTHEVQVAAYMHERILARIQAESAAYAARIPPEAE